MTAQEIERWLSADEKKIYDYLLELKEKGSLSPHSFWRPCLQALESLAECRRLMKKHQWGDDEICGECGASHFDNDTGEELPHFLDCAVAKCIAGYPREEGGS